MRLRALLVALVAFWSATAHAHPTPGSIAFIDFTVDGARLEQDVPMEELERALHQKLIEPNESAERAVERHAALLRRYAAEHVRVVAQGGSATWTAITQALEGHASSDGPRARFHLRLEAPASDAAKSVAVHDDIVTHEVVSHYTLVYVRSDWNSGAASAGPKLVGTLHAGKNDLVLERRGSFWGGFRGVIKLGVEHIATGSDHLMFLFALLLVAPVVAVQRRWSAGRSSKDTLLALTRIVTAFTLGHSLTLALGALGWVAASPQWVEIAIALSISITALHALRPLFPRREALIAGSFGLVHGLAFASVLTQHSMGHAQTAWTLLAFNTGIELAQLGLLFLVVPWVLLLARTPAYRAFRVLGGTVAAALSLGWLLERTTGYPSPFAQPLRWLETHPTVALLTLAATAIVATLARPARLRSATA